MKLLQNRVAESKMALPIMACYGTLIWLLCGLLTKEWWWQFACFSVTCYMMAQLNNIHALIRVYSRMVSCSFIAMMCAANFLFPSLEGGVVQVCAIGFLMMFFATYQDRDASGRMYYAFLCVGLASLVFPHILFFLPVLWLFIIFNMLSFSLRTLSASLMGVMTPYWFWMAWLLYQHDFSPLTVHLAQLLEFNEPFNLAGMGPSRKLYVALLMVLSLLGTIHFINKKSGDKIRIRLTYAVFMWLNLLSLLFLLLQPQHCDMLLRLMTICTAPLTGHFIALTRGKITNVIFMVITAVTLMMTVFNIVFLWMP